MLRTKTLFWACRLKWEDLLGSPKKSFDSITVTCIFLKLIHFKNGLTYSFMADLYAKLKFGMANKLSVIEVISSRKAYSLAMDLPQFSSLAETSSLRAG